MVTGEAAAPMIEPKLRLAWAGAGDQVQVERMIKKARESGQQWGRLVTSVQEWKMAGWR
jgi:hypothetical protein